MAQGLVVQPSTPPDTVKPAENVEVSSRVDTGGRQQFRVVVRPDAAADPGDPKKPEPDKTPTPEAKKEEAKPEAKPEGTRPAWLPAKFETPDAMKASTIELLKKQQAPAYVIRGIEASESGQEVSDLYAELEEAIGKRSAPPQPEPKVVAPKPEPPKMVEKKDAEGKPVLDAEGKPVMEEAPYVKSAEDKAYEVQHLGPDLAAILDKAKITGKEIEQEYLGTGRLSDETYARLAKAGAPKAFVDGVIRSFDADSHALAAQTIADIKGTIGGPEQFDALTVWAKANVDAEDLEAYNAAVSSGSVVLAKKAVKDLYAQMKKAEGSPPKLLKGHLPAAAASGERFESVEEVKAAMSDPRYKAGDKAYHAMVERKLKNSTVI